MLDYRKRKQLNWEIEKFDTLKKIGYWKSKDEPLLPHPKKFVDKHWDDLERKRVLEYLDNCFLVSYIQAGPSWCRFNCKNQYDIGTQDLTDGIWIFPEGFYHYILKHHIKPAEAFLEYLRNKNFHIPKYAPNNFV